MQLKTILVSLTGLFLLASVAAVGASGDEVKGMTITRTGETLIVKGSNGNTTVVLTGNTTTKDDRGPSLAWRSSKCPM